VDAIGFGRAFNTEDSAWQPTTLADGQRARYPAWFHPEPQPDGSFIARMKDGLDIAPMPAGGTHTGVRFNCICPGRVETPFVLARLEEYPDPRQAYRDMAATQLTGRMARPEELATAALYLAAEESAMVTAAR